MAKTSGILLELVLYIDAVINQLQCRPLFRLPLHYSLSLNIFFLTQGLPISALLPHNEVLESAIFSDSTLKVPASCAIENET